MICLKCHCEKDAIDFVKNRNCYCKTCLSEYNKAYREKNKDKVKKQRKNYRDTNKDIIQLQKKKYAIDYKDKISEKHKNFYYTNKEKILQQQKQYYIDNKERIKQRTKPYLIEYRKTHRWQKSIRKAFTRLVDNWKGKRSESEQLLGYTFKELQTHLFQFGDMYDKNMQIDHILSIAYLKRHIDDEEALLKIAHDLRNLMLLPKSINFKKFSHLTIEYVPDFHIYSFFEYVCDILASGFFKE